MMSYNTSWPKSVPKSSLSVYKNFAESTILWFLKHLCGASIIHPCISCYYRNVLSYNEHIGINLANCKKCCYSKLINSYWLIGESNSTRLTTNMTNTTGFPLPLLIVTILNVKIQDKDAYNKPAPVISFKWDAQKYCLSSQLPHSNDIQE